MNSSASSAESERTMIQYRMNFADSPRGILKPPGMVRMDVTNSRHAGRIAGTIRRQGALRKSKDKKAASLRRVPANGNASMSSDENQEQIQPQRPADEMVHMRLGNLAYQGPHININSFSPAAFLRDPPSINTNNVSAAIDGPVPMNDSLRILY